MEMKNLGGRPPLYKTPQELLDKVNDYFNKCPRTKYITVYEEEGGEMKAKVKEVPHYTKSGLCAYLGFGDFTSIYDYENKDKKDDATDEDKQFSHIIKMATMYITDEYESMLINKMTATGAIFALKNMKATNFNDRNDITSDGKQIENKVAIVNSRVEAEEWGK